MRTKTLSLFILFFCVQTLSARQVPDDFKFGMFGVTDLTTNLNPGTKAFGDALGELRNGVPNSKTAIDIVQYYKYFDTSNSNGRNFLKRLLEQADSVNIKVLISGEFDWADGPPETRDGILTPTEIEAYRSNIQWIINNASTNAIAGWYIADEPDSRNIDPIELKKLYDVIKQEVPIGINNDVYISVGASLSDLNKDYSKYIDALDFLIVNYYGNTTNLENTNLDIPGNSFEYHYSSSDPDKYGEGSIRGINYTVQRLKSQLGFPNNVPSSKKVIINLALGEERPELQPDGSYDFHTYQEQLVAKHGNTHSAIRKVYNMGFHGIFFYDYKTSTTDHPGEFREDAGYHWLNNEEYAEIIETEIHDQDWLVASFSNSTFSENRTYLSNRGSSFVNTAPGPCQGVVGQCPAAGYNENHSTVIKNLASGDLWGEQTSDFTYVINNEDFRKNIGDGDDELVYTTFDGNFWVSEENHTQSLFGNTLNSNQQANYGEAITAMTTGDFDGDGDHEVVTAVYSEFDYTNTIYISNDANNFKQKILYQRDYPDSESIITALAAGDFDGIGRDQLVTATWNELAKDTYIYLSDISKGEFPISNAVYSNTNTTLYVNAFAVGDFNGDFTEELATAFRTASGYYSQLTISKPKPGGASGNPGWGPNRVWESTANYEHITALAAGDFKNERKDYLITAFRNSSTNTSNIYQSRPTFDPVNGGGGNPTHTSNPETSHIYQNGTYWHATAMTAGSFRESLPSGASKVVARSITETDESLPGELYLAQNYPNPFNPTTQITYQVPKKSLVSLEVYNMLGQKVATLVNQNQAPGEYTVNFNGQSLASGVYLYILKSGNTQIQKKMLLIK